jgi:hypothetical protein
MHGLSMALSRKMEPEEDAMADDVTPLMKAVLVHTLNNQLIVVKAAQDRTRWLVRTDNYSFPLAQTDACLAAIDRLCAQGLLAQQGSNGRRYHLTPAGTQTAQAIKRA